MGLKAVYERFLQAPNPLNLSEDATLQYVTTLTTVNRPAGIVKHLETQNKAVEKKSEKIISQVEGLTSVAVIVDTTLKFVSSGGAYLPNMDMAFLVDKEANLPITHFVHFDPDNQITHIRLSWDQADLLKQVEVIGSRSRGWPIFAGKDQIRMVSQSTTAAEISNPAPALSPQRGRNTIHGGGASSSPPRPQSPTKKYIKDPHTSLDLFQGQEETRRTAQPNSVTPRDSARPQEREMSDLFAAGHEDYRTSGPGGSPKKTGKESVVAPKGAVHKKAQPSLIFNEDDTEFVREPKIYKTNPSRYNHFTIGDEYEDSFQHKKENDKPNQADMPIRPKAGKQAKEYQSNWSFGDFNQPEERPVSRSRPQDEQHFDVANQNNKTAPSVKGAKTRPDQKSQFEIEDNGTPHHQPIVHKQRKDQVSNFDITDEQSPSANRRIISRTAAANKLYNDPVFGGGDEQETPLKSMSGNARKDQVSSWDVAQDQKATGGAKQGTKSHMRKGLESSWDF